MPGAASAGGFPARTGAEWANRTAATTAPAAAAIQAARMGVQKIVLVNDIEWLGGQFTAEALVAIDVNSGSFRADDSAEETHEN